MENNTKQISKLIYIAWIATTLFFMYQYILRIAPGVLVDEIRQEFKMTAEQFSLLGSLFYYSYALLQIPVGLIIDRIGIKTTVFFSLLLCIIGGTILASTGDILLAYVSRILIGAGASTSFMSALKITADYFPEGKRGILIGATLTMGTIGAIGAGKPFVNLVEHYGWRTALFYTTISGIIIIFLCLITIPRKSKDFDKNNLDQEPLWQSIVTVLKNKKIIVYSLLAVSLYAPVVVIADLWGTAFIMTKYQISRADAANGSVAIYIGMAIGSLILPALCERKNIINSSIKICNILIFITFSFLLFGPNLNFISLIILLFIMGFICGSEMVCFTAVIFYTNKNNSGITIGIVNTLNMLGAALFQQLIGILLDMQWSSEVNISGIRVYNVSQYTLALSSVLILIIVTSVIAFCNLKREIKLK